MFVTSLGLVGAASATNTDAVVIPVGITVPRSDPALGATLIFVTLLTDDPTTMSGLLSVTDDGTTDPFYGTCLISSGLNSYVPSDIGAAETNANLEITAAYAGLITNPLDGSNSITVTAATSAAYLFAFATAYTGVNVPYSGMGGFTDSSYLLSLGAFGIVQCSSSSKSLDWARGSAVSIVNPSGCTPTGWTWLNGELALYWFTRLNPPSPTGANAWTTGSIVTQQEWDDIPTGVSSDSYSLVFAEQAITAPQTGIDLTTNWANTSVNSISVGGGGILVAGPGPTCSAPPPGGGIPILHTSIRLSE